MGLIRQHKPKYLTHVEFRAYCVGREGVKTTGTANSARQAKKGNRGRPLYWGTGGPPKQLFLFFFFRLTMRVFLSVQRYSPSVNGGVTCREKRKRSL